MMMVVMVMKGKMMHCDHGDYVENDGDEDGNG